MPVSFSDLLSLSPLLTTVAGSLALPLGGAFASVAAQRRLCQFLVPALALTALWLLCASAPQATFGGMVAWDALSLRGCALLLALTALCSPLFFRDPLPLLDHPSLTAGLLLSSATGGMLMLVSNHLLLSFVGLELLSIPLYVMVCMGKGTVEGNEAGFKYFILGAVASALFVFGMALLWGETGTLQVDELAAKLFVQAPLSDLTILGVALLAAGMFFKIGLAPFHMWVPDVYESAPCALVAWMAGVSKLAAAAVLLRLSLDVPFGELTPTWTKALGVLALVSMLWGALGGLFQKNLKRLIAYSSVAHAGYLVLGLIPAFEGASAAAVSATLFYVLAYALASFACFAVIAEQERLGHASVTDYRGLYERSPLQAIVLSLALLSLAGLPPLAGFLAKYRVFMLALDYDHALVVVAAALSTVISLGYYLKVVYHVMMDQNETVPAPSRYGEAWIAALACAAIVALGILPLNLLDFAIQRWK